MHVERPWPRTPVLVPQLTTSTYSRYVLQVMSPNDNLIVTSAMRALAHHGGVEIALETFSLSDSSLVKAVKSKSTMVFNYRW